jgi:hypothetical protein
MEGLNLQTPHSHGYTRLHLDYIPYERIYTNNLVKAMENDDFTSNRV